MRKWAIRYVILEARVVNCAKILLFVIFSTENNSISERSLRDPSLLRRITYFATNNHAWDVRCSRGHVCFVSITLINDHSRYRGQLTNERFAQSGFSCSNRSNHRNHFTRSDIQGSIAQGRGSHALLSPCNVRLIGCRPKKVAIPKLNTTAIITFRKMLNIRGELFSRKIRCYPLEGFFAVGQRIN